MTAPSSIDPARFLHDQLASASPDLLRQMLVTFISTLIRRGRRGLRRALWHAGPGPGQRPQRLPAPGPRYPGRDAGRRDPEAEARAQGIQRLCTEASEPARRFFERKGFTVLERQDMILRGVPIHNYRMAKTLG